MRPIEISADSLLWTNNLWELTDGWLRDNLEDKKPSVPNGKPKEKPYAKKW